MTSCRERHFEQSRKATAKNKIKKKQQKNEEVGITCQRVCKQGRDERYSGYKTSWSPKGVKKKTLQHAKVRVQQPGACLVRSPSPRVSLSACSITTCPPPLPALSLSLSSTGWITSAMCARCHTTNTRWPANKPSGTSLLSMMMIHAAVYLTFDL